MQSWLLILNVFVHEQVEGDYRLMEDKDCCWCCFVGRSDSGLRKIKIK